MQCVDAQFVFDDVSVLGQKGILFHQDGALHIKQRFRAIQGKETQQEAINQKEDAKDPVGVGDDGKQCNDIQQIADQVAVHFLMYFGVAHTAVGAEIIVISFIFLGKEGRIHVQDIVHRFLL